MSTTQFFGPKPSVARRLNALSRGPYNPDATASILRDYLAFLAALSEAVDNVDNTTPRSPATEHLISLVAKELK